MNLLLDTHIFLWYINGDKQLPSPMRRAIRNPHNAVYLSVVSLWEATIKFDLGKLPLPESPNTYIPRQRVRHLIASLPVNESDVKQLAKLPALHRDPFDRMLICQAIERQLTLVTVDDAICSYPVSVF